MKFLLPVLAIMSVILLAGCVQTGQGNTNQANTNQTLYNPPASGHPSIEITSPASGDVISSTAVGIKVNVTNFRLADTTANPVNRQNEGHIHYYLDDREQMTPYTVVSYTNVAPGTHTIRAQLVNNDHSPIMPAVVDAITVTTD